MRFRLSLMMFLQWAIPGSLVPLYSVRLEHQLGFSPFVTGICSATQQVATLLSSLIAGQIADRWLSTEKVMAICAALSGITLCILAQLTEPISVFVCTLLFGMVTSPMLMYGSTISFRNLTEPSQQFGPIRMWGTVGWMAMGWAIGAWAGDPLYLGAVVAFVMSMYSLTLPYTPPLTPTEPGKRFAPLEAVALLKNPTFAIYCICMIGASITFPFSIQNTPFLLKQLGIAKEQVAPLLTVAQPSEVIGLWIMPVLLLRLGIRGTMFVGLSAWLLAMSILAIGHPTALVVPSLALNGVFVTGFFITGQVYVNSLADDDFRASIQGMMLCINACGQIIGNLLAGWLRSVTHGNIPPTFAVAAGIMAAILLLFLVGFHPPKTGRTPESNHAR